MTAEGPDDTQSCRPGPCWLQPVRQLVTALAGTLMVPAMIFAL